MLCAQFTQCTRRISAAEKLPPSKYSPPERPSSPVTASILAEFDEERKAIEAKHREELEQARAGAGAGGGAAGASSAVVSTAASKEAEDKAVEASAVSIAAEPTFQSMHA